MGETTPVSLKRVIPGRRTLTFECLSRVPTQEEYKTKVECVKRGLLKELVDYIPIEEDNKSKNLDKGSNVSYKL